MYLTYNNTKYPCTCRPGAAMVYRGLPEDFPAPVTGKLTLCANDGFVMRTDRAEDWLRQTFEGGVLTLTNLPEPVEPAPEPEPTPEPPADLPGMKEAKQEELSAACHAAIVAGIDVELSDGTTGHFSLEETDQINLTTAYNAVRQGVTGYPYHADGQLCKMYTAADIIAIGDAATAHKLYHTTYCNHMMAWARRAETADELAAITYGAELPEDLAANMAEVMTDAAAS